MAEPTTFKLLGCEHHRKVSPIREGTAADSKVKYLIPGETMTTVFLERGDGQQFALDLTGDAAKFMLGEG